MALPTTVSTTLITVVSMTLNYTSIHDFKQLQYNFKLLGYQEVILVSIGRHCRLILVKIYRHILK